MAVGAISVGCWQSHTLAATFEALINRLAALLNPVVIV